jgi:hypothetical protein
VDAIALAFVTVAVVLVAAPDVPNAGFVGGKSAGVKYQPGVFRSGRGGQRSGSKWDPLNHAATSSST